MLFLNYSVARARSSVDVHITIAPDVVVFTTKRTGLVYDQRLCPAVVTPPGGRGLLTVVLDGCYQPESEPTLQTSPAIWLSSEDDVDGALGRRAVAARSFGEPFSSVTFHSRTMLPGCERGAPSPPRRLQHNDALIEEARRYLNLVITPGTPDDQATRASERLLERYRAADMLPAAPSRASLSFNLIRLLTAIRAIYTRAELSPTLTQMAEFAGVSERHVERAMQELQSDAGLPPESFRKFTRRWRLKLAVLLLSSPDYTVSEVARIVGYGHGITLTSALAAEGLPSPTKLRELLNAGTLPVS